MEQPSLAFAKEQLWIACSEGDLSLVQTLTMDSTVNVNWSDSEHSRTSFYRACGHGHASVVQFLLQDHRVDVNQTTSSQVTPFYIACQEGQKDVVALLLRDWRVDVNMSNRMGATPFFMAAQEGHSEVVVQLLADDRVCINDAKNDGCTPLWFAAQEGRLLVAQLMLASGREIDTQTRSIEGNEAWNNKTAAEHARWQGVRTQFTNEPAEDYVRMKVNGPLIADILDAFNLDPLAVRQQLRELPEIRETFIADVFALIIFTCDGLLRLKDPGHLVGVARFFVVAEKLPMELQMVLANRVFGAGKDGVLRKVSEKAFRKLGRVLAGEDFKC